LACTIFGLWGTFPLFTYQKSWTHLKLTWKRQIPKLDAKKFHGHGCTSFPPLYCIPKLTRFIHCTVETLRIAKTSTVALADDLNGCKRVRTTVQVLLTIVWDGNQEAVNMLPLQLAVIHLCNFLVCGIGQTLMQRCHKFEPLPQQGCECKAPRFQFLWMPGTSENWSSLAYGTTFYPTLEKILRNFPYVCHQWIKHKEK